jgi:hypothetical protein
VAYSTCSFNPVENEAVVCAALVGERAERDATARKTATVAGPPYLGVDSPDGGGGAGGDGRLGLSAEEEDDFEVVPAFGVGSPLSMPVPDGLIVCPGLTDWKVPRLDAGMRRWLPKQTAAAGQAAAGEGAASGAAKAVGAAAATGQGLWVPPYRHRSHEEKATDKATAEAAAATVCPSFVAL